MKHDIQTNLLKINSIQQPNAIHKLE